MFSDETELKSEVREMTGYTSVNVLSNDGLDTAYRNAKRHIRVRKSLEPEFVWFEPDKAAAQDALYWWTCLFSKVQTGELDAQDLQAGAVDQGALLAKDDDEVTMWYRQADGALESIKSSNIIRASSPARTDRDYQPDGFSTGDNSGGSGGDTIDSSDL
jgi:hypothetical protein